MRKVFILLTILVSVLPLWPGDLSTPQNGNLYAETERPFHPEGMTVYRASSWVNPNIELVGGRLVQRNMNKDIPRVRNRTVNTDIIRIDDSKYIVLTGETDSYAHGILGDRKESTGFAIYQGEDLLVEYELPDGRVFETLRPLIEDVVPENPGVEIILTSSGDNLGSRIEVYSLEGNFLGSSQSIGKAFRWLHVIGAASFGDPDKKYIAQVKTPHIGGILELLYWNGEFLEVEASYRNVSTHQIGSDNLNMALILGTEGSSDVELYVPSSDFRSLLVIGYSNGLLIERRKFSLPQRLTTNILFENSTPPSLWMGTAGGSIIRIHE
jgi:hypothetical protein